MKKFWGYIKNEKFAIGCTGQTTYVYDVDGNEIAKFKDIVYAYTPIFCPNKNIFVVKSTDGWIAFYSLDTMALLKKVYFAKNIGAQDEGFCFSPDGRYLFNIEKPVSSLATELAVYETQNFQEMHVCFKAIRYWYCLISNTMRKKPLITFSVLFEVIMASGHTDSYHNY